ncbi:phosphoketolase family protein [Synechococcus sp. BA-124 BA4]|uniref:phosphoketolase family protein n=1 Tax=unclassified Synechococcus TaxID=2626047 RepID=UPI002AD48965|nr:MULTISPECIES: phosphoketolase family protein [unclassified Synechococcus]MEA5399493.1 phosphoketolase family protein [Synechococcus sp. BA-124 BA4]CAK6693626.1 Xylulose-5-phosphate phosphoketolase [Synechococcus sp. CBW1107]
MELEHELTLVDIWWRAANYLAVGMIYLQDNPLLREPLRREHIKNRLLGHWGSSPGQAFIWAHANRVIRHHDLEMIYLSGPGHGAPGVLGPTYLDGSYSEVYPDKSQDAEGMRRFFKQFSFPGRIGSHCTPETPGSIHEGGELGYVLSHACGAVFDNPNLIALACVGDGEAETGPLATSWHINKFLNPISDGAVLPVLHLNGYKIANPTLLARIPHEELASLMRGYGWEPIFVEGSEPMAMHRAMAAAMDQAVATIQRVRGECRASGEAVRPAWPMIVLRSPKGWTGPEELHGKKLEGFWRSHQVPLPAPNKDPEQLAMLEAWLRSYRPEELFDADGTLRPELQALSPQGMRRMGSSPHANGGLLRRRLRLAPIEAYAVPVEGHGQSEHENTAPLGALLRDTIARNPDSLRVFGPDETASNRLQAIYEVSKKVWMEKLLPEDADGGELARNGRVVEMLSEHTLVGMMEGYLLTGRYGFFHTYEAFAHVIASMFNQHAKWLESCNLHARWRAPIGPWNCLISSTVWRQDHNGFTHQDPGFIDLAGNKSGEVVRVYLPADANCLLAVAEEALVETNVCNIIVSDKQKHLQYLSLEEARRHVAKGIGLWGWASNDDCGDEPDEPDVVMACAGDIPTKEVLAAVEILRHEIPFLKIRVINVVKLFALTQPSEHPHGLSDRDFDSLFTTSQPVIFNFHGYPWLIHRLTYRRTNHPNFHVRGYKEKGNINTPLELAMNNQIDRFNLVIDVIDRVPGLGSRAAHVKERMKDAILRHREYAHTHGMDSPEITDWRWSLPSPL